MATAPPRPPSQWLVTTDWLASRLRSPDLVVVDGSYYLPQHKRDAAAVASRGGPEQAELGHAGRAPGTPNVDRNRIAPEGMDPAKQRGLIADHAVRLLVELGQSRR